MTEDEARGNAILFDLVRNRVKPERDANARDVLRKNWWQFGWPRRELRAALAGLSRYIATTETAKHRAFQFVDVQVAPDHSVVAIASEDAAIHGFLTSLIHVTWSTAAGARLGVGNDQRYTKTLCFDPFPFPDAPPDIRTKIGTLAERLDAHRKDAIARDERVTMTGMYNVAEKLRSGEALTPKERAIHEIAACGVLRDLHDELDTLVAAAYGWPWPMEKEEILERLVKLHDQRVEEEKRGLIRWLRPDYQIPRFAPKDVAARLDLSDVAPSPGVESLRSWPTTAVEQLAAIGALLGGRSLTAAEVLAAFDSAKRELVTRHLDTLAMMGEVTVDDDGRYATGRKAA